MAAPHETPIVLRDIGTGVGDTRDPIIRGLEAPFIATAVEYRDGSRGGGSPPSGEAAYTITGTGFGTKPVTSMIFEDFEGESLGSYPSGFDVTAGELTINNNLNQATSITTNNPKSGTRCMEQDYATEDFPEIYRALSGTARRHYFACDLYWSGTVDTGSTVWKFGRIGANDVYSGDPKAGESWTSGTGSSAPGGFGGELRSSAGIIGYSANANELASAASIYAALQWHFYELEFDAGTPDGDDCFFEVRVNGVVAVRWEGLSMLTAALSDLPDWILTPLNGLDLGPAVTMWMDNVYSDETRARVVMTDSPVYANSTKWAVQPLQSYSDTSIGVAGKRQGFAVGETAYLYAFNHDGVQVAGPTQITVIED